jgi:hypothetical protein
VGWWMNKDGTTEALRVRNSLMFNPSQKASLSPLN